MQFFGHRKKKAADADQPAVVPEADLKAAYDRGRRFERNRHRYHPMIGLAVAFVALAGAGIIGLAAAEGSFAGGGEILDRQLAVVAEQAEVASRDAASATGEAVRDAGGSLRDRTTDRVG